VIGPDFRKTARANLPLIEHDQLCGRLGLPRHASKEEKLVGIVSSYMAAVLGYCRGQDGYPSASDNPCRALVQKAADKHLPNVPLFAEELGLALASEFEPRLDDEVRDALVRFEERRSIGPEFGRRSLAEVIVERVNAAVGTTVRDYWPGDRGR
jgi:hypothetical protein